MLSTKVQFIAAAIIMIAGIVEAGVLNFAEDKAEVLSQSGHSQQMAPAPAKTQALTGVIRHA